MKNFKLLKTNKTFAIMLICVLLTLSAVSSFIMLNNKTYASEITPLSISRDSPPGSHGNPIVKTPWNSSFEDTFTINIAPNVQRYLDVKIDPKDSIFFDNIDISYEYYYIDIDGKRVITPLEIFACGILYIKENGTEIRDYYEKENDGKNSFNKTSSAYTIKYISVEITIMAESEIVGDYYFIFTNNP